MASVDPIAKRSFISLTAAIACRDCACAGARGYARRAVALASRCALGGSYAAAILKHVSVRSRQILPVGKTACAGAGFRLARGRACLAPRRSVSSSPERAISATVYLTLLRSAARGQISREKGSRDGRSRRTFSLLGRWRWTASTARAAARVCRCRGRPTW